MKYFVFLLIFDVFGFVASAQKNRLTLGLNQIFYFNSDQEMTGSHLQGNLKMRQFHASPLLGYSRLINEHIGIGLDVGFRRFNYPVDQSFLSLTPPSYLTTERNRIFHQSYYWSLSLFEQLEVKRFMFTFKTSLVFEYIPVDGHESYSVDSFINTGDVVTTHLKETSGKTLKPSLMFTLGVNRMVLRNLYFGIQAGLGIGGTIQFNASNTTSSTYSNGQLVSEFTQRVEYKKFTAFEMITQPNINIFYIF